ncbi:MAG: thermonuclease family protein [Acidobacteriota bacterium]|nr:MAG: thermonuclease family protein [Acidobacteriota bacterium]
MSNHYTQNHYVSNHYAASHYTPNHYAIGPFLALLLALSPLADEARNFSGKVVSVTDGDTLTVLREDGKKEKIRLAGIDCPELARAGEKAQAFGERAKEFTEEFSLGKKVTVAVKGTDRYGRVLGEVTVPGGKILNEELLKTGLAWWYRKCAPDNSSYERLEREAREAGRGLWPTPPWEFRKRRPGARTSPPSPLSLEGEGEGPGVGSEVGKSGKSGKMLDKSRKRHSVQKMRPETSSQ